MKLPILIAALLAALPASAQTKFDQMSGAWRVSGDKGDCVAFLAIPEGMIVVASAASGGENHGGLSISQTDLTDDPDYPVTMTLSGSGGVLEGSFKTVLLDTGDPAIYWRAFPQAGSLAALPDRWRARLIRDGGALVDMQITGFAAARTLLNRCVAQTR